VGHRTCRLMRIENDSLKSGLAAPSRPVRIVNGVSGPTIVVSAPTFPKIIVADCPGLRKKQPSEQPNPPTRKPVVSPPGSSITVLRLSQKLARLTHWKSGRFTGE